MEGDMVVKRKAGRPKAGRPKAGRPKVERLKGNTMITEQNILPNEPEKVEDKQEEIKDMFPTRTPIYGEELYEDPDPTKLTKNGVDWDPRENGYEVRLLDPSIIDVMGERGYRPVPLESGIRFKNHPLTDTSTWDRNFGTSVTLVPKDNKVARRDMMGNEMAEYVERRSKHLTLNKSVLGIIPIEKPQARRNLACNISNSSLAKDLAGAAEKAQEEIGNSRFNGKFTLGQNASRSEVNKKQQTVKKIWSVPAQIK
jgi:hypothetical protein